jgi:hypothetical protein
LLGPKPIRIAVIAVAGSLSLRLAVNATLSLRRHFTRLASRPGERVAAFGASIASAEQARQRARRPTDAARRAIDDVRVNE